MMEPKKEKRKVQRLMIAYGNDYEELQTDIQRIFNDVGHTMRCIHIQYANIEQGQPGDPFAFLLMESR